MIAQIRQVDPTYDIMRFARCGVAFVHKADIAHLVDGIAKALAP